MILIDSSVLIALFDLRDANHQRCFSALASLPNERLLTTWCCCTEVMHFLGKIGGYSAQRRLWNLLQSRRVELYDPTLVEIDRLSVLMDKYRDLPMDLADASLVASAESLGIRQILTLDSDFFVYRLSDGSAFQCHP